MRANPGWKSSCTGQVNGVSDLRMLSAREAARWSRSSLLAALESRHGIVTATRSCSIAREAEDHGAAIAFAARCSRDTSATEQSSWNGAGARALLARAVVNSAGLFARRCEKHRGISAERIPPSHYCKGNYFSSRTLPVFPAVYPAPEAAGLGVHLTLDWPAGAFRPDVE